MKRRPSTPPNAFDIALIIESVEAAIRAHRIGDHGEAERLMDHVDRQVRVMILKLEARNLQ
ncbi:hypothetical protein [Methylobacterium radiodurans]|uniref:Uncharacterized protein n=1 Tax=Methylobacterium radiodurans TaxID=2202828 RepID=A0A2U8VPM0_9HYPH|nr:hypothetical protein [Methylobacterium radiodurans]AWN35428.1 hypothetical protein DK427_06545 [Methylobacterium radiodurans]